MSLLVIDDGFTVLKTVSESSHSGDLFLGAVSYQCYLIFKRDWTEVNGVVTGNAYLNFPGSCYRLISDSH